jgi:pimeloyl-ACP methyl ester carboxylesterase
MVSRHVRVEGADVHWVELGQGRPAVLLHGLSDCHRTWRAVAPALARTRRVLMPDLAGHGLSGRPDAGYTLEWHALVMGAWLDSLGLEDVDLVGHSFGGGVAQWLLLNHRQQIRRLGLVASGGLGREVGMALRLCSLPRVVEHFGQPFMALGTRIALGSTGVFESEDIETLCSWNATPGSARALARSTRDVIDWRGQRRHFLERAHEVAELPPLALFWGDCDRIIPVDHATRLLSVVDGATLIRFPNCGHFPHRQKPAEFVHALEAFLDDSPLDTPHLRRPSFVQVSDDVPSSWWRRVWRSAASTVTAIGMRA